MMSTQTSKHNKTPESVVTRPGKKTNSAAGGRTLPPLGSSGKRVKHIYPYIGVNVERSGKQLSVMLEGEEAKVMRELLYPGGTDTERTACKTLASVVERLIRVHRIRIMPCSCRWGRRTITRYWLLDKVHSVVEVRYGSS